LIKKYSNIVKYHNNHSNMLI